MSRRSSHALRALRGAAPLFAAAALTLGHGDALAAGPYRAGSVGHDISFPQCAGGFPEGRFVIVGVNHGRPFDQNPCLAGETASAGSYALVLNTGYDPVYTDPNHTTAACRTRSERTAGRRDQRAAWAAGCSEATRSIAYALAQGAGHPRVWWLDVEIANSWSDSDLTLNQHTLQGIVDTMRRASRTPVGVYSSTKDWQTITGGLEVEGLAADWLATGARSREDARELCDVSFSGDRVWLVQYLGQVDTDYACGHPGEARSTVGGRPEA